MLHAEVLEVKRKASLPIGERGEDAFGEMPTFVDTGDRLRALLNVGREDVQVEGLTALDRNVEIVGASSGYLIVDVSDVVEPIMVGDELAFDLSYGALLAAMTSDYVTKSPRRTNGWGVGHVVATDV
jgi:predicted amino acid racemase